FECEPSGCFYLGEPKHLDAIANLPGKLGLESQIFSVPKPKVGKDIAASLDNRNFVGGFLDLHGLSFSCVLYRAVIFLSSLQPFPDKVYFLLWCPNPFLGLFVKRMQDINQT